MTNKIQTQTEKEHQKYSDKYFLRTNKIFKKDGLNPYVKAQIFIRKGPGTTAGISEAIDYIKQNSDLEKNGGKIFALPDGVNYSPKETQMIIEGNIQDFGELETQYLGIMSKRITQLNDKTDINLNEVKNNMAQVVKAAKNRPILYFGARHWHYKDDEAISKAALDGGAVGASTDIGAQTHNLIGLGTIPHSLENVYAHKLGKENAVLEATKAFDKYINTKVPRIALIDYNNKEIDDSLAVVNAISNCGLRVDTCGENIAQGAAKNYQYLIQQNPELSGIQIPIQEENFWFGAGVTISGIYALQKALKNNGHYNTQVTLTSGFGNLDKINAFTNAEEMLEQKLFDGLGVGSIYKSRAATMDIVAVGNTPNDLQPMSKQGRLYKPNSRLEQFL